jgi:hypothetical protein
VRRFSGEISPQGASENLRTQARERATVNGPDRQKRLFTGTGQASPAPLRVGRHQSADGCCSCGSVPVGAGVLTNSRLALTVMGFRSMLARLAADWWVPLRQPRIFRGETKPCSYALKQ